jgi:hypothetical protein
MHDAEIVVGDVGELRTARAIAHRPDVRCCRLQPLVDLDIAALVEFDANLIYSDSLSIRRTAGSDEKIGSFYNPSAAAVLCKDTDLLAGMSLDPNEMGFEQHLDSLIVEQVQKSGTHVKILATRELRSAFDRGHL